MVRVLLVDDEPLLRKSVCRLLKQRGFEVDEAGDGPEARKVAERQDFDVALVDYAMPHGLNGVDVLATLKDAQPGCARVLMTAYADDGLIVGKAVNHAGITHILPKPFHDFQLMDAVLYALKKHEPVREIEVKKSFERDARRYLRECFDDQLLTLHVQPIVRSPVPHEVVAVEFLLRSRHAVLSNPLKVLEAIDAVGGVHELGALVNRQAAMWAQHLPKELLLFVNLHPLQLTDPGMRESFAPLLPYANRVVLEITERQDITHNLGWELSVDWLVQAGFRFAADDLGAGYNGLRLLAELRPAFIKIDMDITRAVQENRWKMSLVELLVRFANANGCTVVAEGVETAEEHETLERCGAHLLQGYRFARPSPVWPPP